MANSPLVTYTRLSPNHSGKRTHTIDRITPHAVVGQLSVERICDCFNPNSRGYLLTTSTSPSTILFTRVTHRQD